jgi:hypothetical protein
MTANPAEYLDPVLIQPRRVDMKLELGLTRKHINTRLFCAIFMRDDTSTDGDNATLGGADDKIELATEFANKFLRQEFSPAEI